MREVSAVISLLASFVFASLAALEQPSPVGFSPLLVVSAEPNSGVVSRISLAPSPNLIACEQKLSTLTGSVLLACPQCQISQSACINIEKSPELVRVFGGQPVPHVVGQMTEGLIEYPNITASLGMLTCQVSSTQSNGAISCFSPGSLRPVIALPTESLENNGWGPRAQWLLLSGLCLLLSMMLGLRPLLGWLRDHLIALPKMGKSIALLGFDFLLVVASSVAALVIRLEYLPLDWVGRLWPYVLLSAVVSLPIFYGFGLYRAVIRHVGLAALVAIAKAAIMATGLSLLGTVIVGFSGIPRSVPIIQGLLLLAGLGASRALARHWLSARHLDGTSSRTNVLIYGAGSAGLQLASALSRSSEFKPIGLIDDDPSLQGRSISGWTVYGSDRIGDLVKRHDVREILLALPSASPSVRRRITESLTAYPVLVKTLPGVAALAQGRVKVSDLREVRIEDLLGRDPVAADPTLLADTIANKVVLVTGAGGSIGSELCSQILRQRPAHLVVLELSEFALYQISQRLAQQNRHPHGDGPCPITTVLGSVTDDGLIGDLLARHGVQTIYHAAAYKHVPIVEDNVCAGALNNAVGTWRIAQAAQAAGVETFVLVSTDKAVRPSNVMGATKRLAELCLQGLATSPSKEAQPNQTRFVMVRFGNVLGSSGSVIPLFREQIANGGPVTVTDPRVTRYFMTIAEATELVIQAAALGYRSQANESATADVFVLDMGEPVLIQDLAHNMIRLSGLTVQSDSNSDGDIAISYTGLRPGEKLYEELLIGDAVEQTHHPRIMRAREAHLPLEQVRAIVADIERACDRLDHAAVRQVLIGVKAINMKATASVAIPRLT